jgi:hypothetical protein
MQCVDVDEDNRYIAISTRTLRCNAYHKKCQRYGLCNSPMLLLLEPVEQPTQRPSILLLCENATACCIPCRTAAASGMAYAITLTRGAAQAAACHISSSTARGGAKSSNHRQQPPEALPKQWPAISLAWQQSCFRLRVLYSDLKPMTSLPRSTAITKALLTQ